MKYKWGLSISDNIENNKNPIVIVLCQRNVNCDIFLSILSILDLFSYFIVV